MDISSTAQFAATPERVFAMMTDKGYLEDVCRASGSLSYDVSVTGVSTRTSRTLAAPASAARFTGAQLTVVEEVVWGDANGDGSRTGAVKLTILGQPVTMNGRLQLTAGGPGTIAALTGQLKVAIPFIGKKLEESSAPGVLAGFRTQQKVGNDWLQG